MRMSGDWLDFLVPVFDNFLMAVLVYSVAASGSMSALLLIDKMFELTAEKGKVGELGSGALDVVLMEGYATELITYAMSVSDKVLTKQLRRVRRQPALICLHKKTWTSVGI